jgi:thiamine biosynthesis lipoprotein
MLLENPLVAQKTHCAMGTVMTHKAFGRYAEESLADVCMEIERIEEQLSRFAPNSDISRINYSAGVKSEKVSPETGEVLSKAVEFSRHFQGCFDVTLEPLVALWNSGKDSFTPPDESSIRQALTLVNYRDIILDPWKMTAGLKNVGQSIDLGGIGKGYAGDRVLEIFREFGVTSAYSNLGGNVVSLGTKPDGSPWRIGIQHPRQEERLIGVVSVAGQSVVTSGDYQRYAVGHNGKRYHHILNPLTGYPAESGLVSVTIIAEKSMAADALSTAVFVAGMDKGLELLKNYPQVEAVLVDSKIEVFITRGLKDRFQTDENIRLNIL